MPLMTNGCVAAPSSEFVPQENVNSVFGWGRSEMYGPAHNVPYMQNANGLQPPLFALKCHLFSDYSHNLNVLRYIFRF